MDDDVSCARSPHHAPAASPSNARLISCYLCAFLPCECVQGVRGLFSSRFRSTDHQPHRLRENIQPPCTTQEKTSRKRSSNPHPLLPLPSTIPTLPSSGCRYGSYSVPVVYAAPVVVAPAPAIKLEYFNLTGLAEVRLQPKRICKYIICLANTLRARWPASSSSLAASALKAVPPACF